MLLCAHLCCRSCGPRPSSRDSAFLKKVRGYIESMMTRIGYQPLLAESRTFAIGKPFTKESFGNSFKRALPNRMGSARSRPRARPRTARRYGRAQRHFRLARNCEWPSFTRKRQIGNGSRVTRRPRSQGRTKLQHLLPHLSRRCRRQNENRNENDGKFGKWCGREDSNLHGLPR